jgi:phosphoglycolate phosphatase
MHELGAVEEESLYIGDSDVDILLGQNAGLETVGVTWGFRGKEELSAAGATYLCEDPANLGSLILAL